MAFTINFDSKKFESNLRKAVDDTMVKSICNLIDKKILELSEEEKVGLKTKGFSIKLSGYKLSEISKRKVQNNYNFRIHFTSMCER